jgi:hypothetical protein
MVLVAAAAEDKYDYQQFATVYVAAAATQK